MSAATSYELDDSATIGTPFIKGKEATLLASALKPVTHVPDFS
jgi:hypothetical protein